MRVSRHAKDRIKERVGIPKKSSDRLVQKVLEKGVERRQTKGRLNKWLTSKYYNNPRYNETRIYVYGDKAYIFANNTLITVIQIPQDIARDAKKMIKPSEEKKS